jgi:hypothetical protein
MIPIESVSLLITGMICFQVATLIGLVYLAVKEKASRKPPKAALMREEYRP